jgi:hypothetical protein
MIMVRLQSYPGRGLIFFYRSQKDLTAIQGLSRESIAEFNIWKWLQDRHDSYFITINAYGTNRKDLRAEQRVIRVGS